MKSDQSQYAPTGVIDMTIIPEEEEMEKEEAEDDEIRAAVIPPPRKKAKVISSQSTNANKVKRNQRTKRGGSESDPETKEQLAQEELDEDEDEAEF